jgi:large subunit ribosomal protein L6
MPGNFAIHKPFPGCPSRYSWIWISMLVKLCPLMKFPFYSKSIQLPDTVLLEKKCHILKFSGPLGSNYLNLQKIDPQGLGGIQYHKEKQQLELLSASKSEFGLFKKLLLNKIQGVLRGYLVYLKIVGIGYRATLSDNKLFLKLGYSHDIIYTVPSSVQIFLPDPTTICVFGLDKNQTSQIAAKIRDLRGPSPYKGKGIRLVNEKILLKQGKKK